MKKLLSLVMTIFLLLSTPISALATVGSDGPPPPSPSNYTPIAPVVADPVVAASSVLPDKVWLITFSKDVDSDSAKQNISVWKSINGQWIQFGIQPTTLGSKVSVNHDSLYSDGQYQLRISKNIRSVMGNTMSNDTNFDFTVATPVVEPLVWPSELNIPPQIAGYDNQHVQVLISIKPDIFPKINSITVCGVSANPFMGESWGAVFENSVAPKTLQDLQGKIIITYK